MNQPSAEIEPTALQALLASGPEPVIIDVREPWEYAQGSLPKARLVSLGELPHALLSNDLARDTPIVVFCHHGVRSLRARALLNEEGFTCVQSLQGGIDGWACQIDASVGRY